MRRSSPHSKNRIVRLAAVTLLAVLVPATAASASGGTSTGSDIQVSGSASNRSPNPGTPYSYTFRVRNSGPDTATAVTFRDPLPAGTIYNYATLNGSTLPCAAFGDLTGGTTVGCNLGDLAKGAQGSVVVSVNAPLTLASYDNTGTAAPTSADPNTTNNAATVSVTLKASNKNGVNDVAPTSPVPCATLAGVSAPVGYYLTWAAIWNTFSVKSCSSATEIVNVHVTETNAATGLNDYDVTYATTLTSGQNLSQVLDNDFAPFTTTYTVSFTVTDTSGNVLATASVPCTTPPPQ